MGLVGLQKRIYAIIQVALLIEKQKVRAYIVVQELWLAGSKWTQFTVASARLVFVNTFFFFYSTLRRRQAANWNGNSCVFFFFFFSLSPSLSLSSKEIQCTFFILYFWCSSSQDSWQILFSAKQGRRPTETEKNGSWQKTKTFEIKEENAT